VQNQFLSPYNPVAPLNFGERCDMPPEKPLRHALLLRCGKYEVQAFGIPAIVTVFVVLLLGVRWLGLI
jgi:hypothetical protein